MHDALDCSLHFLTLRQEGYDETNVALSFYHDRTHFEPSSRNLYAEYTEEYCAQQGRRFVLHNRLAVAPSKQSRLKDQVKELDELLKLNTASTQTTALPKRAESNVAVALWLSAQQLLVVLKDATLVWLIVDTISVDIVKMQMDKTLPNSGKLSGTSVSDCAYLAEAEPMLVLAYSDVSKIDLVSFNKSAQMSEYLKKWKSSDTKLEKLSTFEPALVAYEFACPNVFRVEKRICTRRSTTAASLENNDLNVSTEFVLWWPNEPQQAWLHKNNADAISLLERDDLRTNVLVLTVVEHKKRTSQVLTRSFKSDAQLLAVRYDEIEPSLLAVEQSESTHGMQKYSMTIYKYDLSASVSDKQTSREASSKTPALKIKLRTINMSSLISSFEHVRFGGKYVLAMCSIDQTLIIYDTQMNTSRTRRLDDAVGYEALEWLVDELLFVVYETSERGRCRLLDVAFNEINLKYATRAPRSFESFSDGLGEHLQKHNRFVRVHSSRRIHADSLLAFFHYSNGPVGIFRLAVPNAISQLTLVAHYLKCAQLGLHDDRNPMQVFVEKYLRQAVNLLLTLDWQEHVDMSMACLTKILNFMLGDRLDGSLETQELIEKTLSSFYKPIRALSKQRIYECRHEVSRYARRYFYKLLKWQCLHKAFALAVDIGAKDLLNDLYYCSLEKRQIQLADACRLKYGEMCERDKEIKLNAELSRSIQSVDDNLEATRTELDKLSVSSSSTSESFDNLNEESEESVLSSQSTLLTLNDAANNARLRIAAAVDDDIKISQRAFSEAELHDYVMKIRADNEFLFKLS
jgi:hypothetical protein